ncbi:T9SS type A sorting domain-containing protein, partial [candidate division TA06 bacterium]
MKRLLRIIVILTLTMFVGVLVSVAAPASEQDRGRGFLSCLTEEQRETVEEKIKEMRNQGASREEIRGAVGEMLKGYGIDSPERRGIGRAGKRFLSCLTEEQRETVEEKIKEMRNQGASREEIRAAVGKMLKGYGIERPERRVQGRGRRMLMEKLTEEQRRAVQEKTKEMRKDGANRKEIGAAIGGMLKGYGIESPRKDIKDRIRKRVMEKLTEDQSKAVKEKVKEMRDRGASRKEIRAAMNEMLKGYGIELPERRARGRGRRKLMEKLTDEQRKAVREKVKGMRDEGASRKEIRAAVREMLKGYGVKEPEGSGAMSSVRKSGGPHVVAQAYPNPFDSDANISYALNDPGSVRVSIYNTAGQLIRSFDMGVQDAGTYTVHWDGNHEDGTPATSGVYQYRIDAGDKYVTNS